MIKTGQIRGRGVFLKKIGLAAAAVYIVILAAACTAAHGGLTERELAAAKSWKPTRWSAGKATALVVMDMQVANMPIERQEEVVANIRLLVAAADAAGSPVIWIYDNDDGSRPGDPAFELMPDLKINPGHLCMTKTGTTAFSGTQLKATLDSLNVGRVVFAGVYSDECVRNSVEASFYAGWLTVVAGDAHSIPVGAGRSGAPAAMNARWSADRRVRLQKSAAISFSKGS